MITALSDLLYSVRIAHADFALLSIGRQSGFRLCNRRAVQMHLVLQGECNFTLAGNDDIVVIDAGSCLFAPMLAHHEISCGNEARILDLAYFDEPHVADEPPRLISGSGPPKAVILSGALEIDPARHESLVRLIPEIRAYRRRAGPTLFKADTLLQMSGIIDAAKGTGASATLLTIAELLLTNATRESLSDSQSPDTGITTPDSPQIAVALRVIHEHPERDWTVAALAREAGMSRTVFAAAFLERLGETPIRYVSGLRMTRANSLLREGRRSLSEIAHLSGYDSEAAFARAFKRSFGSTPGQYRRNVRALRGSEELKFTNRP